ncbi:MAG: hypothetical protein EPO01_09195 [Aquabacterium sp.]|nr:MAG: hypothetical protein EPO01_09195 [Aquabacterium sp.]
MPFASTGRIPVLAMLALILAGCASAPPTDPRQLTKEQAFEHAADGDLARAGTQLASLAGQYPDGSTGKLSALLAAGRFLSAAGRQEQAASLVNRCAQSKAETDNRAAVEWINQCRRTQQRYQSGSFDTAAEMREWARGIATGYQTRQAAPEPLGIAPDGGNAGSIGATMPPIVSPAPGAPRPSFAAPVNQCVSIVRNAAGALSFRNDCAFTVSIAWCDMTSESSCACSASIDSRCMRFVEPGAVSPTLGPKAGGYKTHIAVCRSKAGTGDATIRSGQPLCR